MPLTLNGNFNGARARGGGLQAETFSASPSTSAPYTVVTTYSGDVEMSPDGEADWEAFSGSVPDAWTEVFFRWRPTVEDEWTVWETSIQYSAPIVATGPTPLGLGAWDFGVDPPLPGQQRATVTGASTGTVQTAWDGPLTMPRNNTGSPWDLTFTLQHRETGKIITSASWNGGAMVVTQNNGLVAERCDETTETIWAQIADGYGLNSEESDQGIPCTP